MWKCSQCETLNGDDSPICIICGMSREEVLAEQKRLELERALAASIPAKPPEVTLNWPKEEDTPAPEEPSIWKELGEGFKAGWGAGLSDSKREALRLAGRILAFAALFLLVALHVTYELRLSFWAYGFPSRMHIYKNVFELGCIVLRLAPPVLAMLIPFLLGKKQRNEAILAAVALLSATLTDAIALSGEFRIGFASQSPTLLLGIVLLICAWQGEIQHWVVPVMKAVTVLSFAAFLLFTCISVGGFFTTDAWVSPISWEFLLTVGSNKQSYYIYDCYMTTFYPIHRVFLALAVTLLFRANREK
ncbi:MAG: hypothetical protein ACI4MK_10925 [Aristaeellaceae bacterium]